ncbi:D-malate degradation protein R [Providencia rustigianii]|uniref:LysR substrate binding domain protein n=2 Tax=Providencia rustigianii TaxID=158850 RepID=D1P5X5_9GAMM|nr:MULTISPECIES: LysR family transcriptional regulator [Providencia]EFB71098.1 LysR substrate binding domain protein [Providencia rustigianii DSM 4541]MTC58367.1 LysR family transcriptional regulator [Providencia rustigianii]MTC61520.1 LysR family transcriptional regulator [Providencia rustigianii]SPY76764.1 D-malate degradation protein R [Providencia rustigianii]SUC25984.1 D-malate degradation protein R [Providencia rustigianii]
MDRLKAVQVFITIVEQGSLSGAADKLDMSRAMVTRYLAEMEQWAGVRLLNRTTRRLSLTSAGESVYQQSLQLNAISLTLPVQQKHNTKDLAGLVRISCSQSIAQSALSLAISEFLQLYPNMMIDMQISNKSVNLIEERIDLAIRITNQLEPSLIAKPLSTCHSVICASPAFLKNKTLPTQPEDLALLECLTYSFFGRSLWSFEKEGKTSTVLVDGRLSANESVFLMEAALNGAGIAMQPYYSVAKYLQSGELIQLLPDYTPMPLGIYGVYTSRQHMPTPLRAVIDFLANWFNTSSHWHSLMQQG